jgi:hypothetical protein
MQSLEEALRRKDPDPKIFFAPKSLRAEGLWLPELACAIAEATAFVLLIGEKGIGPWQIIEYYEALDRCVKEDDFPVLLVLLDGQPAPGLPFLRQLHWVIAVDPASEKSLAQVMDAASGGSAPPGELWRHTALSRPFRHDGIGRRFLFRPGARNRRGDKRACGGARQAPSSAWQFRRR